MLGPTAFFRGRRGAPNMGGFHSYGHDYITVRIINSSRNYIIPVVETEVQAYTGQHNDLETLLSDMIDDAYRAALQFLITTPSDRDSVHAEIEYGALYHGHFQSLNVPIRDAAHRITEEFYEALQSGELEDFEIPDPVFRVMLTFYLDNF